MGIRDFFGCESGPGEHRCGDEEYGCACLERSRGLQRLHFW